MERDYSSLAKWLIEGGQSKVLCEILWASQGARSKIPHPDPVEAGAMVHEATCRAVLFGWISYYLEQGGGGEASAEAALMDAWSEMGCPGLVDQAVVDTLKRHELFEAFMAASRR